MKRRQSNAAVQYTIRNVPKVLDKALRSRAARLSKSLNEVAIEALADGVGISEKLKERRDLDFFFGSWVEDPAVDQALEDQRKIDEEMWR